jgi:pimeloyl-ACP methyl ester carboxylesterase
VVLFGESLGSAVALQLAVEVEARALVLESPFASIPAMARAVYPFLPLWSFVRTRYDNVAKVGWLRMPLLVLHGERDEVARSQPASPCEEEALALGADRVEPLDRSRPGRAGAQGAPKEELAARAERAQRTPLEWRTALYYLRSAGRPDPAPHVPRRSGFRGPRTRRGGGRRPRTGPRASPQECDALEMEEMREAGGRHVGAFGPRGDALDANPMA